MLTRNSLPHVAFQKYVLAGLRGVGVGFVADGQVVGRAIERTERDRVRRGSGDAAILDVDPVPVGDEVSLSFLHPEDLGFVARPIGAQALDVH
jgi:hypothetical protein